MENDKDIEDLEPSSLSEINPDSEEQIDSSVDESSADLEEELIEENPNENMDLDKLNTFYYLKQKYEQDKKERCNKFKLENETRLFCDKETKMCKL